MHIQAPIVALSRSLHALLLVIFLLPSCAIQLAPNPDKTIVDGLGTVNTDMMTFFASVSNGADATTFDERQATYNAIVGTLDALKIQAMARPAPRSNFAWLLGPRRPPTTPDEVDLLEAPTADIIATMAANMTKMRDVDESQGLTPVEIAVFKGNIEISMDQALTYEKALER